MSDLEIAHKGSYIVGSEEFEKELLKCEIVEVDYFDKKEIEAVRNLAKAGCYLKSEEFKNVLKNHKEKL